MGINVGAAAVTAAYLGSTAISSIYLGNTLVFSATPANVVTVNANITAPVTWTAGNIYQVTTDIQITGTNTIVTVEAGAIVEVADGVTITLGPGVGGVGNNTGIDGTGATFRGMTGTDNWRINSSYYGGVFDVTNCSFTGVTLAQLRPRQSSNGRVQINGCLFDRCGGFAGTTYAVDLEPYGAAQNTIVEFANNIFSNTVSIGCIDYSEVQADSILSPAVSGCFFDQNVRVSANSTGFQNNVADAVELNVAMLAAGCTVDGNHLISRSGASNNVDLLNFRANTLVRNNVLFGGIHTVGAFAGYHDNIIRDNVIIAQPGVSNEQIAFPGNNAIIDNNLFLQGGQQASIIFADETGVRIDDNTFVGGTPYNIYLNHTGGAGVAGQVISVEGNAFTGSTIGGMFDEDTFAAAITLIGKNLYTAPSGAYKVQINAPGSEVAPVLLDPGYPAVPAEVSAASWDMDVPAATYRDSLFALYPAVVDSGEYLGCAISKLLDADPDVGGGSYTQNLVANNGTGQLHGAQVANDADYVEISMWVNPTSPLTNTYLWQMWFCIHLEVQSNGALTVFCRDENNVDIFNDTTVAGTLVAGSLQHVYLALDHINGVTLKIDGVDVTWSGTGSVPTWTNPTSAKIRTRFVDIHPIWDIPLDEVGDVWANWNDTGNNGYSAFHSGGSPVDLSGLGTPIIHLGGSYVAADWNAGTHNGSLTLTVDSATFSDVGGSSYTQNFVNNNGNSDLSIATFGLGNQAQKTTSFWFRPNDLTGTRYFESVSGRGFIGLSNAKLTVAVRDSAGTYVYNSTSTNDVFTIGTLAHVQVTVDLSVPSLSIKIDGSDVVMDTDPSTIVAGTGVVDFDRGYYLLGNGGSFMLDGEISDFIIDDSVISNATLYNGGTPPDPTAAIPTPVVLLGATMVASDWNSGTNLGTAGSFTPSNTGFTDV